MTARWLPAIAVLAAARATLHTMDAVNSQRTFFGLPTQESVQQRFAEKLRQQSEDALTMLSTATVRIEEHEFWAIRDQYGREPCLK